MVCRSARTMDDYQLCVGTRNEFRSDLAGGVPPHRACIVDPTVRSSTHFFLLGWYNIGGHLRVHRE